MADSPWALLCPLCAKVIDSQDSYADSLADMRDHYAFKHPGEVSPYE